MQQTVGIIGTGWVGTSVAISTLHSGAADALWLHDVRGAVAEDLVCEILSTQPYPLARVCARHDLGRFRVTQKANLDRDGELAAMRHQLQVNGIADEPPAGWLPDSPEHRALLTGEPPTAP